MYSLPPLASCSASLTTSPFAFERKAAARQRTKYGIEEVFFCKEPLLTRTADSRVAWKCGRLWCFFSALFLLFPIQLILSNNSSGICTVFWEATSAELGPTQNKARIDLSLALQPLFTPQNCFPMHTIWALIFDHGNTTQCPPPPVKDWGNFSN